MGRTDDQRKRRCVRGRKAGANPPMVICYVLAAGAAHSPSRAEQPCIRKNLQTGSMRLHYFLSASAVPPILTRSHFLSGIGISV